MWILRPDIVINNELKEKVYLNWRSEKQIGVFLGPQKHAEVQPKTRFKISFSKGSPVILVSIAREVEEGSLRIFQCNIPCVPGHIINLREMEGDADFGLLCSKEEFLRSP